MILDPTRVWLSPVLSSWFFGRTAKAEVRFFFPMQHSIRRRDLTLFPSAIEESWQGLRRPEGICTESDSCRPPHWRQWHLYGYLEMTDCCSWKYDPSRSQMVIKPQSRLLPARHHPRNDGPHGLHNTRFNKESRRIQRQICRQSMTGLPAARRLTQILAPWVACKPTPVDSNNLLYVDTILYYITASWILPWH